MPELARIARSLRMPPLVCGSVPYTPLAGERTCANPDLPMVSIVTVTFNAAASIEAAIRSVAAQTYAGPIEYIVVDGGSTDATLDLVGRHSAHVDCLVTEPDEGIYDAMNKGLLRARGTYVALLNADDRLYPDFVEESVRTLRRTGADISFCDYETETEIVTVDRPDPGLFLSQLGIKHNTFLVHRNCFERVGGFDPALKIVADARWNRTAYASGLRFAKLDGPHVFYSTLGLSAGSTEEGRERIISESVRVIQACFPELDPVQARTLYTSNFNTRDAGALITLSDRFAVRAPLLSDAIRKATIWNLGHRPGYRLKLDDPGRVQEVLALAGHFGVPLDALRFVDPAAANSRAARDFLAALERAATAAAGRDGGVHLHFAREFSRPSETFVHDLLTDLAAAEPEVLHVMLCDRREDAESRPYDHVLALPWHDLPPQVRRELYALAWQRIDPRRIIAHFALNGWWLHERLTRAERDRPWINMCHGIDVFTIDGNENYTRYIRDHCALSPNVAFTAVSGFLARLLTGAGVPRDRIFTVPNAVADHFARHRKTDGFWNGDRPLRILSTGRLVPWKGHDVLIEAIAALHERKPAADVELTIVYGRVDDGLEHLEALADRLGIRARVTFLPYVDFRAEPDFLPGFDLFVLPSTTSDDPMPRTETFGVAMIEALASGLPVIGTDAGGIPEVVGPPSAAAVLVPHGQVRPLADAIAAMIDDAAAVFARHDAQAADRSAAFSAAARIEAFAAVGEWLERPRKRIVHFCALGRGGAAGASINIHKGLLRRGYDSVFVTRDSERDRLPPGLPGVVLLRPEHSVDFNHLQAPHRAGFTTFTLDDPAISDASVAAVVEGADLINLTWSAKFLSVRNIAMLTRLGLPVAVTLRDMQPITGGCHFFHGCDGYTQDCTACPQLPVDPETDYAHLTLAAKTAAWNLEAVTFVALSDHSMGILERSTLARDVPRVKLPNFVDVDVFHPDPDPFGPEFDNLPDDAVKIGYLPSFNSRIKGHDELCNALRHLDRTDPDLRVVVLLASNAPLPEADVPCEVRQVGSIQDRDRLRRFYNAADIVAVPSLEETFSNTTLEALACGTPVVGFRTGILDEVLQDGRLGASVETGDASALADAISKTARMRPDREAIASEILGRFGWEPRISAYEDAFGTLMGTAPPAPPLDDAARDALDRLRDQTDRLKTSFALDRLRIMRDRSQAEQRRARETQDRIQHLEVEIAHARHRIDSLQSSRSWRLMAPYRVAGRFFMKHFSR